MIGEPSRNRSASCRPRSAPGTELRQAIAAAHAVGMRCYGDLVLHQCDGFDATKPWSNLGADGKTRNGRFPFLPSYFVGGPDNIPVDPVPDSEGNFGFGTMWAYLKSTPEGVVLQEMAKAVDMLQATMGFDGFRVDDVKGTNAPAVMAILNSVGMVRTDEFGEYFDGDPQMVARYVYDLMHERISVLDFAFKFNTGNICNNTSRSWMGSLANAGFCVENGPLTVTFAESADTDNSPGEQTIWNKMLQYALMATFPGKMRLYYRDVMNDPDCYGMGDAGIWNLVYWNRQYANGRFVSRLDTDYQVFACERLGLQDAPGGVSIFNNDQYNRYTRTIQTSFWGGTRLHELSGKGDDVSCDNHGNITVNVPENENGFGFLNYAMWTPPEGYSFRALRTTQRFYCAEDLDTPALVEGPNIIGMITPAIGSQVTLALSSQLPDGIALKLDVVAPSGTIATGRAIVEAGQHSILITATGVDPAGISCTVLADYLGAAA